MLQDAKDTLIRWNNSTSERNKLQHSYLVITIIVILISGIISLINGHLGHQLTYIALASISIFIINALVWNLLSSIIIAKIPKRIKRK